MYRLIKILSFTVLLLFIALIVLVGLQVFLRYILNKPLFWANDLSRFFFLWTVMLSMPLAYYNNVLPKMEEVTNKIFKNKNVILIFINMLNNFIVLGFGILMVIYGNRLSMFFTKQKLPTLPITFTYIYISIFFSGIFLVIICIVKFITYLKNLKSLKSSSKA